jgi:hypothetical protein
MKRMTQIGSASWKLAFLGVACSWAIAASGALYTFGSAGSDLIPDEPDTGLVNRFVYDHPGDDRIADVTVTFTISGGWNGDLYAYLSHGSDGLVLLNRVGVANGANGSTLYTYGYSGAGFNNITLSDAGLASIHSYGGATLDSTPTASGTYRPDGQAVNPLAAPTAFSPDGGSLTFNDAFGGKNPNGTWTLFFADMSAGSMATLEDWSVGITAVPEPVNVALVWFAVVSALAALCRRM